ncbi:MAG: hypothetical protein JRN01_05065 [Nitrososphaerota archaeon]|jgi:hypothetical protein|nr:hypothetical protein [Nitrososphaerota archaeon]
MKALRIAGAVVVGIIMIAILVIAPEYMMGLAQKITPSVPVGSIIAYFFNTYTLALGAVLAVVSAIGVAVNQGVAGGAVKAVQGIVGMLYFLYMLHFGAISITISAYGMPVSLGLALTVGLALIELAFLLMVVEGLAIAVKH